MKTFKKILLLILIFIIGFAAGNTVKYYLDFWRADQNVQSFLDLLEAPYKNDKYGGKTPEETFDLYLAALKKGDLELASKYFVVNKQKSELEYLRKLDGEIDGYIKKLEDAKKIWTKKQDANLDWKQKAGYEYSAKLDRDVIDKSLGIELKFEAGKYKNIIQFEKNGKNFWKIQIL